MICFAVYRSHCESYIGRKGGKQLLLLGRGCKNRGKVTHELMHALGFFHEHTRPDRDKFVKILWENIKTGNVYKHKLMLISDCSQRSFRHQKPITWSNPLVLWDLYQFTGRNDLWFLLLLGVSFVLHCLLFRSPITDRVLRGTESLKRPEASAFSRTELFLKQFRFAWLAIAFTWKVINYASLLIGLAS